MLFRSGSITEDQWDDLLGSNLKAPLFLCQAALPHLRESRGVIINIVDIHSQRPLKNHPVYGAAKAGLAMLTRSLAKDLGPDVRVNGVSPGAILWPESGMPERIQNNIIGKTPLKRAGEPEDIAGAVLFLVRDAPYVTGQILAVDGGRSGHRILEDLLPAAEDHVAGHDDGAALVAFGDQGEQHVGLLGLLLQVAEIVEDQNLEVIEPKSRRLRREVLASFSVIAMQQN